MVFIIGFGGTYLILFVISLIFLAVFFYRYRYKFVTALAGPFLIFSLDLAYCYSTYLQYGGHSWSTNLYPFINRDDRVMANQYCYFYEDQGEKACVVPDVKDIEVIRRGSLLHRIDIIKYYDGKLILYGFKNSLVEVWGSEGVLGFRRQFYSEQ